jgi:alpha-glucuronidase
MRAGVMAVLAMLVAILAGPAARAEDGYDLWLRYRPVASDAARSYRAALGPVTTEARSPTLDVAAAELRRGLSGMLGTADAGAPPVVLRTGGAGLPEDLGREGFVIRSETVGGRRATVVAARSDVGVLYGAFHLLRRVQTGQPVTNLDISSAPKLQLRVLNHWDNLDRTVERGYAGQSLWDWHKLPDWKDPRYVDYARANASVGINGAVLNNVNAKAESLTAPYIAKAAALADVFRPYGVRVYLSARFSAPIEIGGLKTADPLDPAVRAFWQAKADEIYRAIPDFGGFLVKANSEGQPGPQDYGRSHADGANMLAQALASHGGVVMWRAFVYSAEQPEDRVKQAYGEFVPLDGRFAPNVIVQVKNGPLDFQPREPFHPLFGATPNTPLMLEVQLTKEYLGFATHLAYLAPLWEEVLQADTWRAGRGSTVAKVTEGRVHPQALTGMAGVANIGTDRNWTGSHFDQANWYAFGRLAWDPETPSAAIARDWAAMTFSADPAFVAPAVAMMLRSREAVVDYMTPLGLTHLMGTGHHYGPAPWVDDLGRADWTPVYYHRAGVDGIGFDRTRTGSDAVAQYAPRAARALLADERFLLWFRHLPWDHRVRSGRTLWDELVVRYDRGVGEVADMQATWAGLGPYVDRERHAQVAAFLGIQRKEAQWWRDASIAYFRTFARRPLPAGHAEPPESLTHYKALTFPDAPGHH